MNNPKRAHPDFDRLTAFAQGRLDEAALVELASHLGDCAECREKVEVTGDDTLISLLRAADTAPDRDESGEKRQAATLAPQPAAPALPGLPAELAAHGRYHVQELLGVGGMGAVYKAEHLLMERPVALKLISRDLTSNRAMVERFRREVKTAAKLKHPNIVMAYDAEQAGESHFLVMEYVEGTSLARLVAEQGPLPVSEACDYIRQAALGLQHAHERGMVHRDIKPQNLMRTPDGQVKILDFGLARFAREAAPTGALLAAPIAEAPSGSLTGPESLTQVGTVMGTPDYIAPEQAQDAHSADIRADLYSLGCTLYDLLAGHAPFPEGTAVAKVRAHGERTPQPLTRLRKDVPPALARVVDRLMAKDPANRYRTPAEVADALAPFAAAAPIRPRRPWRTLVAAAAVASAVLLAGAVIYVQTDRGEFVINTSDEKVAVIVNSPGVKIRDQLSGREYLLKAGTQDVRTGNYKIVSSELPEGLEIEGDVFTIKRNGRAVATAKLRKKSDKERLKGEWVLDQEKIQGTWKAVSGTFQGQPAPEFVIRTVGPSITFTGDKVTWKANPVPEAKNLFDGRLAKFSLDGIFHLDPAKSPRTIDLTVLGRSARTPLGTPAPRVLLGIYKLEGDSLELCIAIDPDRAEDRPGTFVSIPGRFIAHIRLQRDSASAVPPKGRNSN
jgi:uncharacterized protein (TIGR03067 family)